MKRVRFEVCPIKGVFGWEFVRDGHQERTFLFKFIAVQFAVSVANFESETFGTHSELTIKGKDGRIMDKRTYPRSSDPRSKKG